MSTLCTEEQRKGREHISVRNNAGKMWINIFKVKGKQNKNHCNSEFYTSKDISQKIR